MADGDWGKAYLAAAQLVGDRRRDQDRRAFIQAQDRAAVEPGQERARSTTRRNPQLSRALSDVMQKYGDGDFAAAEQAAQRPVVGAVALTEGGVRSQTYARTRRIDSERADGCQLPAYGHVAPVRPCGTCRRGRASDVVRDAPTRMPAPTASTTIAGPTTYQRRHSGGSMYSIASRLIGLPCDVVLRRSGTAACRPATSVVLPNVDVDEPHEVVVLGVRDADRLRADRQHELAARRRRRPCCR